jgi:D-aminopeptidase
LYKISVTIIVSEQDSLTSIFIEPAKLMRKLLLFFFLGSSFAIQAQNRIRDWGLQPGILPTGKWNAITDVKGVKIGHVTLSKDSIQTGVTAILPHSGNLFQQKVPAAIYIGNGFGKLAGYSQVKELGNIETPIILTNTLSVAAGLEGLIRHTFSYPENKNVASVNGVVGETNDGQINDIRGLHVKPEHVLTAIQKADTGKVAEGNVGAGTGTIGFGYKAGIGTSSRKLPAALGGYTVGVIVQTNFGGVLMVDGLPVGEHLKQHVFSNVLNDSGDGSCMIVIATDAPVDARNLERMAKRAMLGLARTGGIATNGSGDYVIAFSTYEGNRIQHNIEQPTAVNTLLSNEVISPLFLATVEATEEAILNSLTAAKPVKDRRGRTIPVLDAAIIKKLMKK